jgi:hypothetical protein
MYLRFLVTLFFAIQFGSLFAQDVIYGKIICKDSSMPVPYVNILLAGKDNYGTTSAEDGIFSIQTNKDFKEISFSHVSYQTLTIQLANLHRTQDTIEIFLSLRSILLSEVIIKPEDYYKLLREMLKGFVLSYKEDFSFAKTQLIDEAIYNNRYISFQESVGYFYYTPHRRNQEIIYLPFNTRSSKVVYPDNFENTALISHNKQNSFRPLKERLSLFKQIGPLNPRQWRNYQFVFDDQNSVEKKIVFQFTSNPNARFYCKGSMQFDLVNNIIDWVKIDTLLSAREQRLIRSSGSPMYFGSLDVFFQHKDNRVHFQKIISRVDWSGPLKGLRNELLLLFHSFPRVEDQALFGNPGEGFVSSFMLYGESLVRIYYDEDFWNQFKYKYTLSSKIIKDLEIRTPLIVQFKNNHLKYCPELDEKRYIWLEGMYRSGEFSDRIQTSQEMIESKDFLSRYKLIDSYIRPFILDLNKNSEMQWKN